MTATSLRSPFGALLRDWRRLSRASQLSLALDAEISQRHLYFLETGRARPSREMVLRLGNTLNLPLREQNELLVAAGFAPLFPETALSAAAMARVRSVLETMLRQQEPFPAVVLDRRWNLQMTNASAGLFFRWLVDLDRYPTPINLVRLMFDATGLRPFVKNWEVVAEGLRGRIKREAIGGTADREAAALLQEIADPGRSSPSGPGDDVAALPVIPIDFEKDGLVFRFFSAVTTLGTPRDITSQELRVECFFPADAQTEARMSGRDGAERPF